MITLSPSKKKIVTKKLNLDPPKPETNEPPATEIRFEKMFHDFGDVVKGDTVEFVFKFKNVGEHDFVIEFASGSCGCTVPDYPEKPIKPGESAEIKVSFDTSEKDLGENTSDVTIIGNTAPIVTELKIRANVIEPKK